MKIPKTRIRVHIENGSEHFYPEYQVKEIFFDVWRGVVIERGRVVAYTTLDLAKQAVDNFLKAFAEGTNPTVARTEFIEYP